MSEPSELTVNYVIGLDGRHLTIADLPTPDTKRWVIRRKAEVVVAVQGGLLSLEEAFSRYALNSEEFLSWQNRINRFGLAGLRTIRIRSYLRPVSAPEKVTKTIRVEPGGVHGRADDAI